MKSDSDARLWVLIALGLVAALGIAIGFLWYLDSAGTADGPNEGLDSGMVADA